MKLYYAPGACSLSPDIALREAGIEFTPVKLDFSTRITEEGTPYSSVNPKGYVPALELDNGEVLTENPVIAIYIGDQKPESGLSPAAGTMERYRVEEWLAYIGSEVHHAFGPLFGKPSDEARVPVVAKIMKRLGFIETSLEGKQYLMGDMFTAADCYAFAVIRWHKQFDLELTPNIAAYMKRIAARPAVQAALAFEGLTYP